MDFDQKYNLKSKAVKRIMREARELNEATEYYFAQPLEDNLFEWHFTIRGPSDSAYSKGIYHGRIILPSDYPMKPPNIIILTPNGKFETNKKICLSISGHHPETWLPSWSIRTALLALIGFMPTKENESVGSIDYTDTEIVKLAEESQNWTCNICGKISNILKKIKTKEFNQNIEKGEPSETSVLNEETQEFRKHSLNECTLNEQEINNLRIRVSKCSSNESSNENFDYSSNSNSDPLTEKINLENSSQITTSLKKTSKIRPSKKFILCIIIIMILLLLRRLLYIN